MFRLIFLLGSLIAFVQGASAAATSVALPIYYSYGGYPRIMSNITYGTPPQKPAIPTVMDLGSANYWVYQHNATVNYGSPYLFTQGPCNVTAHPSYNFKVSSTATKPVKLVREYSYGGNGKIIEASHAVNDTVRFGSVSVRNVQVEAANFTIIRQSATDCKASDKTFEYDHSILGLSRFENPTYPTTGPSFRQNLLDTGEISSPVMSMWFNKPPQAVNGTFHGEVQFGSVAANKYKGNLTQLKLSPPSGAYVGYYIPAPTIEIVGLPKSGSKASLKTGKTTNCLIDSGTGLDNLAINQQTFLKTTGLVLYGGYPAYNGSCNSIPAAAALRYTFAGLTKGTSVTISVPLRSYARGITDYLGTTKCGLSLSLSGSGSCVLGAPFTTAMFLAVDDAKSTIAIAQGGVA